MPTTGRNHARRGQYFQRHYTMTGVGLLYMFSGIPRPSQLYRPHTLLVKDSGVSYPLGNRAHNRLFFYRGCGG